MTDYIQFWASKHLVECGAALIVFAVLCAVAGLAEWSHRRELKRNGWDK